MSLTNVFYSIMIILYIYKALQKKNYACSWIRTVLEVALKVKLFGRVELE